MREPNRNTDRVISHIKGESTGPLMILVGGMHGNETAGIRATERIFKQLESNSLHGELIGLRGNLSALAAHRRFIDYDLNRCWTDDHVAVLHAEVTEHPQVEDQEAAELLAWLDHYATQDHPIKVLADLHTTSAERGNFVIVPAAHARHPVVETLFIPVVSGMEPFLPGTLMVYAVQRGFVSFAFEGGQIGSEEAVNLHEAGIWMMLHTLEMISLSDERVNQYRSLLQEYGRSLPRRVAAKSMHMIVEGADFAMNTGYYNFKPVHRGEVVAHDQDGPIVSPQDGMIFMPLYQKEGKDGFFIVEEEPWHSE